MKFSIWTQPWWVYDPETTGVWGQVYRGFNFIEGIVWIVFAVLVAKRFLREKKTRLEIAYAIAFFLFGLTDFREAWIQSAPLVLVKGVILVVLFLLRRIVIQSYSPEQNWY